MKAPTHNRDITTAKDNAEALLRAALTKKALQPVLIRLTGVTSFTDYFLIVSARSPKQVTAVAEAIMEEGKKLKLERISVEGLNQGAWALLDYGDVVAHVFHTPVRAFYDLEGLWAEAPRETFPADILEEIETASQFDEDYEDDEELFSE